MQDIEEGESVALPPPQTKQETRHSEHHLWFEMDECFSAPDFLSPFTNRRQRWKEGNQSVT